MHMLYLNIKYIKTALLRGSFYVKRENEMC